MTMTFSCFFDAAKYMKTQIDQKDPTAYTEDAFIWDIFLQLKHKSLPSCFYTIKDLSVVVVGVVVGVGVYHK